MKKKTLSLWNTCLRRRRGMALISLLAIIVLLTALVVGFLVRAGSERISAANYHATASARLLADTAVNLVQAQINEATSQGTDKAWASQPGVIRVFDSTGALTKFFRLYSAPTLTSDGSGGTSAQNFITNDVPASDWAQSPALWVDLNRPVVVTGATSSTDDKNNYSIFPILDPRDPLAASSTATKPGVTTQMPGFAINNAPGATEAQPAPMPTRWLYVLQSGAIVPPTSNGPTSVKVAGSTTDPIVGRIAFWTDDESSKVNINTAAGSLAFRPSQTGAGTPQRDDPQRPMPAPWQPPRFRDWDDYRLYSQNQPVPREYQRFPGHPATTDLYATLRGLGMKFTDYPYSPSDYTSAGLSAVANSTPTSFFNLLPRYSDAGGSKGGTTNTTKVTPPVPAEGLDSSGKARSPKFDRLYASLGEFFYSPTLTGTAPDTTRITNGVSRQMLESSKFFLTTSSRAPDVTLFGTPRISLWPISSKYGTDSPGPVPTNPNAKNYASPYDQTIAFCTSLRSNNGSTPFNQYYFQRWDSTSTTWDFDAGNIPRNPVLYKFLQNLTSQEIPGFGGNFLSKYSNSAASERDQILTEMVDYIRCTNLFDYGFAEATYAASSFNRFTGSDTNYGMAVPLRINNTQGLGRAPTISELGILLICVADGNGKPAGAKGSAFDWRTASNLVVNTQLRDNDTTTDVNGNLVGPTGTINAPSEKFPYNPALADSCLINVNLNPGTGPNHRTALVAGQKRLQAILLVEPFCPMMGYGNMVPPSWSLKVSGLSNLGIGGLAPFPSGSFSTISPNDRTNTLSRFGGYMSFQYGMSTMNHALALDMNLRLDGWTANSRTNTSNYPFVSNPFTISGLDPTTGAGYIQLGGGPITIEVYATKKGLATLQDSPYQTFTINFPATTVKVPELLQYGFTESGVTDTMTPVETSKNLTANLLWGFDRRLKRIDKGGSITTTGDSTIMYSGSVIRADPSSVQQGVPEPNWTIDKTKINAYYPGTSTTDPLHPSTTYPAAPRYKNPSPTDYAGTEVGASQAVCSDVTRTMLAKDGDARLVMAKANVVGDVTGDLVPHPGYQAREYRLVNSFQQNGAGNGSSPGCDLGGKLVDGANYGVNYIPKVPSNVPPKPAWDWDSGIIGVPDGPYANKPDEGNIYTDPTTSPYYNGESENRAQEPSYFTPNRIIPSAVMFGSLPTGVKGNVSWRTLLFRPMSNHDGLGGPKDHLLLDLFTMPVIEPYAISEPLSTAGRVNMNYQIVPFTYIHRSSAVRAVLTSELIARVPKSTAVMMGPFDRGHVYYKSANGSTPSPTPAKVSGGVSIAQLPVNVDETTGTLRQFEDKFSGGEIFKSASEICDLYLVPESYNISTFATDWYGDDFALVGDNVRERPYANIYPRLTTKSNTYTVHYTVQALKNPTPGDEWNEARGAIVGEYRGSTTIERFVDPNNKNIPDYATTFPSTASPLDKFYQWRIVANNQFAP